MSYINKYFKKLFSFVPRVNPIKWSQMLFSIRRILIGYDENYNHQKKCCVLITPWDTTSIPVYSLVMGMLLNTRGCKVTYIYDDETILTKSDYLVNFFLKLMIGLIEKKFEVIRLSSVTLDDNQILDLSHLSKIIELNSIWYTKGELDIDTRSYYEESLRKPLTTLAKKINTIQSQLADLNFDFGFLPGGLWGTSGLWLKMLESINVRVSTYDCGGYNTTMICSNGLACQLQDIEDAYKNLKLKNKTEIENIKYIAKTEIAKRRNGVDKFKSQMIIDSTNDYSVFDDAVLIALNSSWDGAALGIHHIFSSNENWILESIDWLLKNTNLNIIIRQHPAERLEIGRTSDDYKTLLNKYFESERRIIFIAADDHINSYELIDRVKMVIVASTTFGVEAASFGVPVLSSANCYYSNMEFVYSAKSKEQFFEILQELTGDSFSHHIETDNAFLCFYLTQNCNWVWSEIYPEDVSKWLSKFSFNGCLSDIYLQNALTAVVEGVPISYLNHMNIISSSNSD